MIPENEDYIEVKSAHPNTTVRVSKTKKIDYDMLYKTIIQIHKDMAKNKG